MAPKLLKIRDVMDRTGLGRSTVWAKVAARDFPGPVAISQKARRWREDEVDEWIQSRTMVRPAEPVQVCGASLVGRILETARGSDPFRSVVETCRGPGDGFAGAARVMRALAEAIRQSE